MKDRFTSGTGQKALCGGEPSHRYGTPSEDAKDEKFLEEEHEEDIDKAD